MHSFATFVQLVRIEGATLRAPEGEADDRADAWALACVALTKLFQEKAQSTGVPRVTALLISLDGRCRRFYLSG